MRNRHIEFVAGIVVGAVLFGGGAAWAVTEHLEVQRSHQPIYVDGEQVELEAYNINGANYVKLRDVGQAVDFEVYWDGAVVRIASGQPYTGLPPVQPPALGIPDYSQEANPVAFTEQLTPEVYNTIREAILTGNTASFGSAVTGFNGLKYGDDEALFQKAEKEIQEIENVLGAIGLYPNYQLVSSSGSAEYLCQVRYAESYEPVKEHTGSFISGLEGLDESEAVSRIAWYVCDRLTYTNTRYAWPDEVLTQDGVVSGACMSYAYSFKSLCDLSGIPCILVASETHEWNMVYVDGQWLDVDVTGNDSGDDTLYREYSTILRDPAERYGDLYMDLAPDTTRFAKELLVPGSTK